MIVRFHFPGDDDIVETFPDSASSAELQHRAVALGCRMYTPEIWYGDDASEDPR